VGALSSVVTAAAGAAAAAAFAAAADSATAATAAALAQCDVSVAASVSTGGDTFLAKCGAASTSSRLVLCAVDHLRQHVASVAHGAPPQ